MAVKETVYFEGGPHRGELIFNLFLIPTLFAIPLAVGAFVRALWLRFRITDRRVSVTGGWRGLERTDVIYSEITKIISLPRGLGLWGDMVLTLRDGSRLELRAVPKFREVTAYIEERMAASKKEPKTTSKA